MPEYHFDMGDSTDDVIGITATVTAPTIDEAIEELRNGLPSSFSIPTNDPVGNVQVYINPEAILPEHVDEIVR